MKISLIVPIYNVEKEIRDCLESIRRQTYDEYEVIMVNDGSTDQSGKIAKEYEAYEGFYYYEKVNGGLSDARNYGIKRANGQYLFFVDSDDLLEESALKIIASYIENKKMDVLEVNAYILHENGMKEVYNKEYVESEECCLGIDYMIDKIKSKSLIPSAWSKIVNKEFLEKNNLYFKKGRLHEDELWCQQVFFYAKNVFYANVFCYNYRMREGSITHSKNMSKNIESCKKNCFELQELYSNSNIDAKKKMILKDYLARQMMSIWSLDNGKTLPDKESKQFVKRNTKQIRTICKMFCFCIFPRLYIKLRKLVN